MDEPQKEKVKSVRIQCALSIQCTLHLADIAREADVIFIPDKGIKNFSNVYLSTVTKKLVICITGKE